MVVGIMDIGVTVVLVMAGAYFTAAILFAGVAAMVGWGEWMLARQGPKNSD